MPDIVRFTALPLALAAIMVATVARGPLAETKVKAPQNGYAQTGKSHTGKSQTNSAQGDEDEIATFILGNTIFTLYHELAHALVHQLQLPVLGREEDAADSLAVLMMLPDNEDAQADALLLSAADGYGLADEQGEPDDLAFWDEHSLDLQRYAAVNCLIFGSDPEGFADLAQIVEMPEEQQERCPEIYRQTADSWQKVLERHLRKDGTPAGKSIRLRFERPGRSVGADLVALLKGSEALRAAVRNVADGFVLPADLTVAFAQCDESNAFYDPETGNVTICYELVAYFAELVVNDIAAR